MRIPLIAVAFAVVAMTAACGQDSAGNTLAKPAAGSAAPAAGAAAGAAGAAAGDAMPADDAMAAGGAAGDAKVPQITAMEADEGNDGDMAKLPQGKVGAAAVTAGMGKDGAPVITVTATDTACVPDKTSVPAGKVWLKIINRGAKVNELYLESAAAKELVEVENIKTGQFGGVKATVKQGKYLIACEPGMADNQIRTPLTVTAAQAM